ncbi:MAG: hypothetical protein ABR863_10530 [Roseiarcus sp.]|jgi:hypothetical protein
MWMSNSSSLWQIALFAGLLVAIALILAIIYRVAFGHRLRVPGGGRARQPRLGLVDAFSLDGQRQLVLLRRDNVEHLVMIGGPNDVLVESQIIRAAVSTSARERDAAAGKALPIAPVHALGAAVEAPLQPAEPAPQPPRIAPRFETPTVTPEERSGAERVAPAPLRQPIRAVAPGNGDARRDFAPARPATHARSPLPPPIVVAPAARTRATPVLPPEAAAARPQPVARPSSPETPASAPAVKPPLEEAFGDLESLEAEMARLLGRDV